jgi:hypothetical protein
LHVHPSYPTKFMALQLGAVSTCTEDRKSGTIRAIVNGAHATSDMSKLLEKYIEGYVVCAKCRLPELYTTCVDKTARAKAPAVTQSCVSCGHSRTLDPNAKLVKYMATTALFIDPPAGRPRDRLTKAPNDTAIKAELDVSNTAKDAAPPQTWSADASKAGAAQRARQELGELTSSATNPDDRDPRITPGLLLRRAWSQSRHDPVVVARELRRIAMVRDLSRQESARLALVELWLIGTPEPTKPIQPISKYKASTDQDPILLPQASIESSSPQLPPVNASPVLQAPLAQLAPAEAIGVNKSSTSGTSFTAASTKVTSDEEAPAKSIAAHIPTTATAATTTIAATATTELITARAVTTPVSAASTASVTTESESGEYTVTSMVLSRRFSELSGLWRRLGEDAKLCGRSELLCALQGVWADHPAAARVAAHSLQTLYDKSGWQDTDLISWYGSCRLDQLRLPATARTDLNTLIQWLRQPDDDDDDDDQDDE